MAEGGFDLYNYTFSVGLHNMAVLCKLDHTLIPTDSRNINMVSYGMVLKGDRLNLQFKRIWSIFVHRFNYR